jgi:cytochrome b6-f complex iron-sulfur subunit
MQERRRFLQVLSGSMVAAGVGCGGSSGGLGGSGQGGNTTDTGGAGGTGGDTTATTSTTSTSTTTDTTSTTTSSTTGTCGNPPGVNVGMASKYATNGLHKVSGTKVLVGRDDGGLFARSSLCTHQNCDLNTKGVVIATGMHCNCHGGEFDITGKATKSPATGSLKSYALAVGCDGSLFVDTTKTVPADTRLMV